MLFRQTPPIEEILLIREELLYMLHHIFEGYLYSARRRKGLHIVSLSLLLHCPAVHCKTTQGVEYRILVTNLGRVSCCSASSLFEDSGQL